MGRTVLAVMTFLVGYVGTAKDPTVVRQKQAFEIKDNNGHYCKLSRQQLTETGSNLYYDCNGREVNVFRYRYELE